MKRKKMYKLRNSFFCSSCKITPQVKYDLYSPELFPLESQFFVNASYLLNLKTGYIEVRRICLHRLSVDLVSNKKKSIYMRVNIALYLVRLCITGWLILMGGLTTNMPMQY